MKWHYILLFLLLCAAAAPAGALNVALTSSNGCVVANNTDSAVITVIVTEGSNQVKDAGVSLSVTQPWGLQKTAGTTNSAGQFGTTFLPTTKSGSALITATVIVSGKTIVANLTQNITADTPSTATSTYQSTATVGTLTEIAVLVLDRYGNPVDSKKNKNLVYFTTSYNGNNFFVDNMTNTTVKDIAVELGDTGLASVAFLLDTKPGDNYVVIQPPNPLPMTLISIQGIADAIPASITQMVTPGGNPPTLPTDGISKFTIEYQLYDQYGNPSTHHNLSVSADTGENLVISSNTEGKVTVNYGPESPAGKHTITATALDNPSVTVTQVVQFANSDPTTMLLTASPQTMASRDVDDAGVSLVMAKVIDNMGNPVQGESVFFTIQSVNNGTFIQTRDPLLGNAASSTDTIGVVSDENGYATVNFHPGAFTKDTSNPGYSPQAEATARVKAVWGSVTQYLNISYKNYPYLSVSTSVNPMTVATNNTVDVSIRIKGNGYALQPKPIDVMLVSDRSGTMLWDNPDRELLVMSAAKTFASKFDYSRDRMGQISFGGEGKATVEDYPSNSGDCGIDKNRADDLNYANNYKGNGTTYADYANLDLALSSNITAINTAIDGVVPDGNTPMRYGLYKAITELKNNGNPNSVRAVVLLTDGDYNEWGDPLARGSTGSNTPTSYSTLTTKYYPFGLSNESMAAYASANNVRIYTIAYGAALSTGGIDTLTQLAAGANGTYHHAMSLADLNSFYTQIRGALMDSAGVNTTMNLNFQNVAVWNSTANNWSSFTGSDVVQYVYIDGKSTLVTRPNGTSYMVNSTGDWNDDHKLTFNFGTIKVNEEWVVNFTMKILKPGNIKILGSSSQILFDKGNLTIPDTYITGLPPLDTGLKAKKFTITNLTVTLDSNQKTAYLAWNISYDGNWDIPEDIEVAPQNSEAYSPRGSKTADKDAPFDTYPLDVSGFGPGSYKVRVTGNPSDANSDFAITQFAIIAVEQTPQIIIR